MPPRKGGPQSPFSKLAENAGTGSPGRSPGRGSPARSSRAGSPAAPPGVVAHDTFLTPRTHEGTQHRRLRTLLQELLREATFWEETHTFEGIQLATSVKQAWEDVARCLASYESATEARSGEARRAQVVPLLQQLEECSEQLSKLLPRLRKHTERIGAYADTANALLRETASTRAAAALREPMWGTWTMEQFVLAIQSLAQQYALSFAYVQQCVPRLCGAPDGAGAGAAGTEADALAAEKRACLEQFVRLPHLHPTALVAAAPAFGADAYGVTGITRTFLQNVCEVEVRGWEA